MKKKIYFRLLAVCFLLCVLTLPAEKSAAQEASLCFDLHFLPAGKVKKNKDTTCLVIENGFMYNKAEEIVRLSGLPMNFIVCKSGRSQNAFASLDKHGNRYLKYDDAFLTRLNSDSTALESMLMLAHEIGHHIFFHTILSGANEIALNYQQYGIPGSDSYDPEKFKAAQEHYYEVRRNQELEADRFAGFVMAKKKISFEQLAGFYKKLDAYYTVKKETTHPPVDKRIDALREGYRQFDTAVMDQPVNLSKLGKERPDLVFNNVNKLERNKLLKKIVTDAIDTAARLFTNGQYKLGYGTISNGFGILDSAQFKAIKAYLGRNLKWDQTRLIDDAQDFVGVYESIFYLLDAPSVVNKTKFVFHIKAGYFYLVIFDPVEGTKVAYKARFSDDQISYEEIKLLYARIFKIQVQKLIDDYSK